MDAYEGNNIYIAELGCRMGQAWGALKKSWRELKYNLSIGDYDRVEELKARISCNRLGKRGNLVKSSFAQ
jgi:hypothetical protein